MFFGYVVLVVFDCDFVIVGEYEGGDVECVVEGVFGDVCMWVVVYVVV